LTQSTHGPWDYIQDWDLERMGSAVTDRQRVDKWATALGVAGAAPYIWRELARPVRQVVCALMELRPGDRVLIIGEAVEPSGIAEDIRLLIGPGGRLDCIEIAPEIRSSAARGGTGRNGKTGCWPWDYSARLADQAYDCLTVFQAARYCDEWQETARDLLRVMMPGRRLVLAEAVPAGPSFTERAGADLHLLQWCHKVMGLDPLLNFYSGDELAGILSTLAEDAQSLECHGIELAWARKPQAGSGGS
jgi:hypothetical protein